ncbi:MAG: signal recognition particle subunit SRP19/SEC65 family protein [Ignisphaera sp.]|uniref:Signal recognition particle 19 kDa protein n=1 Tax=Ignisphaera aggregans TaxID=334771 RepID=A0A7C4NJR7_9CREN
MSKEYILWLSYFDCSLKRRLGRRLPLSLCIDNPRPSEFIEVCKKLGLECNYLDKRHPRVWYRPYGSIIVKNPYTDKNKFLKVIAKEVKEMRRSSSRSSS